MFYPEWLDYCESEGMIVNDKTKQFTDDDEAYNQFWHFVLRNVDRFKDKETIDDIQRCHSAWMLRCRDQRDNQLMEVGEEDLI